MLITSRKPQVIVDKPLMGTVNLAGGIHEHDRLMDVSSGCLNWCGAVVHPETVGEILVEDVRPFHNAGNRGGVGIIEVAEGVEKHRTGRLQHCVFNARDGVVRKDVKLFFRKHGGELRGGHPCRIGYGKRTLEGKLLGWVEGRINPHF